jgi:hypothetical protein
MIRSDSHLLMAAIAQRACLLPGVDGELHPAESPSGDMHLILTCDNAMHMAVLPDRAHPNCYAIVRFGTAGREVVTGLSLDEAIAQISAFVAER